MSANPTILHLLTEILSSPEFGFPGDAAKSLAVSFWRIAINNGAAGSYYYLPRHPDIRARNAAILCEYNGHNVRSITKKYNLSARQVYRIVKETNVI
jgi:Mor family transcriptional regulator